MLIVLFLLVNDQSISIFQSIFSPAIKILYNFWPLFRAFVLFDTLKQLNIFFRFPRPFFKIGIEIAIPMFSALLGISEYFIFSVIEEVKSLWYHFPIFGIFGFSLIAFLVDQFSEKIALFLAPVIRGKVDFF